MNFTTDHEAEMLLASSARMVAASAKIRSITGLPPTEYEMELAEQARGSQITPAVLRAAAACYHVTEDEAREILEKRGKHAGNVEIR